jgi:hypothetical protein
VIFGGRKKKCRDSQYSPIPTFVTKTKTKVRLAAAPIVAFPVGVGRADDIADAITINVGMSSRLVLAFKLMSVMSAWASICHFI